MMSNHKRCRMDMDGGLKEVEEKSTMRNLKRNRVDMVGDVEEDRLSYLPREMIDCILKHLPVEDAARTSILSKTWRNKWAMNPHLLFGDLIISSLENIDKVSRAIDTILLLHVGPILDFYLIVHPKMYENIQSWIKHVSNEGVRNLKLINVGKDAREIPCLFDCSKLTDLNIVSWVLNPPCKFGGFTNLLSVRLSKISITADMSFGPQLEVLKLIKCTGIEHLRRQFMDSNSLFICASKEIEWQWFEHTQKLDSFALALLENSVPINLNKLLGNMSNISSLHFDVFKFLEPGPTLSKRLTTTMENLTDLLLYHIDCNVLCQIAYAMCLMRSSPNLRYLSLTLESNGKSRNPMELTVERYIGTLCSTKTDRLQVLRIKRLKGSKAELHFLKLLLASSPSLRRVIIIRDPKYTDPKEEPRITRELMQFDRASTAAQIIWS